MRFTSVVAGIAFIAGASAISSEAVQMNDDSIVVSTAECMDGYWECITNCPTLLPSCATWGLNCAIIYC
ncbi:hypothetical protein FQN54_001292 [Arachnomyces sp. PD_36]|nr:hypothetical protein FQN54_001292 [Arachnomyces sp. PD_36]